MQSLPDVGTPSVAADSGPADTHLECPSCFYNLTGLVSGRCPECGHPVDWDKARRLRERNLRGFTPLERWPWPLKPVAFAVTIGWVLVLPWDFARRIPSSPRLLWPHVLAIASTAIGVVAFILWKERDWAWLYVWGIPVWLHIELETIALSLVAGPLRTVPDTPGKRYRFWRVVALYTTGVVALEFWTGPPMIGWGDGNIWPFDPDWPSRAGPLGVSVLYFCWWLGLTTIAVVRSRSRLRGLLTGCVIPPISYLAHWVGVWLA